MKIRSVLLNTSLFASLLLAALPLFAQQYENDLNLSIGGVGYIFDSKRNQDDDIGFFVGGEVPLVDRWSGSLDFLTLDSDVKNFPAKSDVDYYRLGVNYYLNQLNGWQPYAGVGLGMLKIHQDMYPANREDGTAVDFAIGVKHHISDNWLVKGDYKLLFGDHPSALDSIVSVGVSYAFGRSPTPVTSRPTETSPTVTDSDNDGVPDSADACRNTPDGVQVDRRGCEVDSDRDGVVDSRDRCPDTPIELMVDANGCPVLEVSQRRQELLVNFDFDRSEVKPEYDDDIADFADFMETYGNTNVVIEGHTDSVGTDEYNQGLSERRANAVKNELVNEHNIESGRVSTVGYGESRPVATNETAEGRAQNRRIEAVISVDVEEQRRR